MSAMPREGTYYRFEEDFLSNNVISEPIGDFRLFDGTRVKFFFTPRGLVMRIWMPDDKEALKISREMLDDNQIRSIFFGSNEVKF